MKILIPILERLTIFPMIFLVSLALLFSEPAQAKKKAKSSPESNKSVNLLFKARGLQALERIEALGKKNGDSKGANLSKKEHCEWALETAYMAFMNPSLSTVVRKQDSESEIYSFFIRNTKSGDQKLSEDNFSFTQVSFLTHR